MASALQAGFLNTRPSGKALASMFLTVDCHNKTLLAVVHESFGLLKTAVPAFNTKESTNWTRAHRPIAMAYTAF